MRPTAAARVVAAVAVAAVAALGCAVLGRGGTLAGPGAAGAQDEFTVTGELDGIYPGLATTLDAQVTNPWERAIEVTSVDVTAGDAGPGCPGSMLIFGGAVTSVEVPGHSTGVVPVEVRMDIDAPDACQGATWPLAFTAHAVGPDGAVSVASPSGEGGGGAGGGGGGPGAFAFTGARILALVVVAVALIVVGLVILAVRRRRAREAARTRRSTSPSR